MNEQEVINELYRMKKQLSGAQGCSLKTQEANQYRELCLRRAISALGTINFLKERGLDIDKLKEVDFHKEVIEKINYNTYMELMNEVLELREKQTPYIPKPYKQYAGACKCGVIFMDRTTNYCGNCGQRLDWGD